MTASEVNSGKQKTALDNNSQSESATLKNALAIFLFALLLRLWFNFGTEHVNAFNNADASEYLRYATALSKLDWLHPVYGPEWKEFVISGPAFPFALWLFNFFSFEPYSAANYITPLILQSIVSAAISAFAYLTANRLFGKNPAICTAIASTIYPAFIVNSGRLYSEVFATFLLSAALWLFAIAQRQPSNQHQIKIPRAVLYFALGATVTLLQLTRSAMLLFTIFTGVFVLIAPLFENHYDANGISHGNTRSTSELKVKLLKGLKHLAIFLAGFALITVPWLFFEKSAFNRTNLVVDRTGNYNLFIGTATKIQGFLSYPYPDGAGIQQKSFSTLIRQAYKERPAAFVKLMLDKPARLYKFPWNDYRTPIGPVGFDLQVLLHELIILFAVIGLCLGFATSNGYLASNLLAGRLYLLFAFLMDLPYLAFITVPRYNLVAMPVLIIFAGVGLCTIYKLISEVKREKITDAPDQAIDWRLRLDNALPQITGMSAVFLFAYLRDDLRPDSIFAGSTPLAIYLIQATPVSRGIISGIAGLLLFSSLYLLTERLTTRRAARLAKGLTVICALALLPLLFVAQRANGRFGEAILSLTNTGGNQTQIVKGTIPLSDAASADSQYYLAVDSDRAQILDEGIAVQIDGTSLTGAPIPGLAALDDWQYLKVRADGTAYLDCTYIFDCMTQTAGITNLDVRQWYLLPVPPQIVKQALAKRGLEVAVKVADVGDRAKSSPQLSLFGRCGNKPGPAMALYSWEKAFYGVENDRGLTDTRMDQRYTRVSPVSWQAGFEGKSEKLDDIDLNFQLIECKAPVKDVDVLAKAPAQEQADLKAPPQTQTQAQALSQTQALPAEISISGKSNVVLDIGSEQIRGPLQLVECRIDYPQGYDKQAHFVAGLSTTKPILSLTWTAPDGVKCSMLLPWTKIPQEHFAVALPVYLQNIKGKDIKLNATYIDDHCTITLKLKNLTQHPLFAPQTIY